MPVSLATRQGWVYVVEPLVERAPVHPAENPTLSW